MKDGIITEKAENPRKKASVFILLGQSNAVGHGVPMKEEDRIAVPLKNVFGLHRRDNQSLDVTGLKWSGYTSAGMNLGETQDDTYSVANCLAALWQEHIDSGNALGLGDLYIIHIAVGAEGVTREYMWYPQKPPVLVGGKLGTADISLFGFSKRIFSLLDASFAKMNRDYEIIGVHWRGGENDVTESEEYLKRELKGIYEEIFDAFRSILRYPPLVFHRLVCADRMKDMDATGVQLKNMEYINSVFGELVKRYPGSRIFDAAEYPGYTEGVRGGGIFMPDAVHYTPEVNRWVAGRILRAAALP